MAGNVRIFCRLPLPVRFPKSEIGILTIREKWEMQLESKARFLTSNYLSEKYPLKIEKDNLMINGSVCPNLKLVSKLTELKTGEALYSGDTMIACRAQDKEVPDFDTKEWNRLEFDSDFSHVSKLWKIFLAQRQRTQAGLRPSDRRPLLATHQPDQYGDRRPDFS